MPRVVDHDERRAAIAAALFRVVRRDGIHAVSVRTVAAEAGASPSALRHYFTSQDELLAFALQAVVDRVRARLVPLLPTLSGREGALTILEQMLPLDATRRGETEVYFAFAARAQPDSALRRIRDSAEQASREAVRYAVGLLADSGSLGAGRDPEQEAARTYALVDGLALHGALWPRRHPAASIREVLHRHLDELATAALPSGG
jgi:AcrR family transcriptional regulator